MEELTTKVTKINNIYYIRLYKNDKIIDEATCRFKYEISIYCKHILRWYNKLGGTSKMA